ncbi:S28 family serine protease [Actinokineospora guangxiensis]|uniref:S28 family serine protease n=1 Tax=Actinokineospora guangxiensis TaxID=1490288 RepID=A0ABW0ENE0_9PSEU
MSPRPSRTLAAGLAAVSALAMAATPAHAAPNRAGSPATSADIAEQLRAIPGMTVISESATPPAGYRFFVLGYTQPVDHTKPAGQTFQQRFQLLHKATDRPMVLHTTGYGMPAGAFRSEPTRLVDGNQISVEQRYFTPSRPSPADWDHLNIWQAATDHHRLVRALDPLYPAKWISTGASKGGMTSVYHRRYYPGDVDGVVAYVAPNDRVNPADAAYDRFFATVGGDTPAARDCRARLDGVQAQALRQRATLVARYAADAEANGWTFAGTLGTVDRAFEMTVLDSVWAFWQYAGTSQCTGVPGPGATAEALYTWIDTYAGWSFYTDQGVTFYNPYYYQAATQLGWASLKFTHLRGLTRYPGLYSANTALPPQLRSHHNPLPMLDIDLWVRTRAAQMLFVYGENDPWGAEAFTPSRHDSHTYTAPGANHGANIAALTPADRDAATAALQRWAGVSPAGQARAAQVELPVTALDRAEPRNQRHRP